MDKKFLLILVAFLSFGCANQLADNLYGPAKKETANAAEKPLIIDPTGTDLNALPTLGDLPLPAEIRTKKVVGTYKGVIKNTTNYDLSVPSLNSGATLIIPARGFIEYIAYSKNFDLTVYSDGKPFYCFKIHANPKNYQYMCKQYDFLAEIVKPEPVAKPRPVKKKRYKRKPKSDEAVKGLG